MRLPFRVIEYMTILVYASLYMKHTLGLLTALCVLAVTAHLAQLSVFRWETGRSTPTGITDLTHLRD
jgi:hypothetical protein